MSSINPQEARTDRRRGPYLRLPDADGLPFRLCHFLDTRFALDRGPANAMHGKPATLDHTFKDVVTPNADTPYSMAMLDLRTEPVVLQVPESRDCYYVWQFVDLFGTNPHFIGSRATGSDPGTYLAVGPGWDGKAGDEFDGVLPFDTDLVFVIGRTQLLGAEDVPALTKVMTGYNIVHPVGLSRPRHSGSRSPSNGRYGMTRPRATNASSATSISCSLFASRPTPQKRGMMARFAQIGIGPSLPFVSMRDDKVRETIRAGIAAAQEAMAAKVRKSRAKSQRMGIIRMLWHPRVVCRRLPAARRRGHGGLGWQRCHRGRLSHRSRGC